MPTEAMDSQLYSLYGLAIRSEIALHAPPGSGAKPDLSVAAGPPREVPSEPAPGELLCEIAYAGGGAAHVRCGDSYVLRYFNTAEFHFDADLTHVTAHSDPRAQTDLVPEFLMASVPAFKLLLSGRVVLHASAVARRGRALGILAPSGGGKSTLASVLCRNGFSSLTDDVLTFDWRNDVPWARIGPAELRLRAGSVALTGPEWTVQRRTIDGRTAVTPIAVSRPARAVQMAALIVPEFDKNGGMPQLTRLEPDEALVAILGHLRVTGWKDTQALRRVFPEQVRLARQVPAYRLSVPWGTEGAEQAVRTLVEHHALSNDVGGAAC